MSRFSTRSPWSSPSTWMLQVGIQVGQFSYDVLAAGFKRSAASRHARWDQRVRLMEIERRAALGDDYAAELLRFGPVLEPYGVL